MTDSADVAATFCATLVDEWVRGGVLDAVVCPGSRSTPVALALADDPRMRVHVHHDERSAGFIGLGLSLRGRPAVVLTTSGTAAVELHPAAVEAHHARVPLLLVTADRPPELWDVGAPQTIDQTHLFGRAVRWFAEPGVPDAATRGSWRSLGARAVAAATGVPPGPVHLNLAFREPLVGTPGTLPPARSVGPGWPEGRPWTMTAPGLAPPTSDDAFRIQELSGAAGVIVAGLRCGAADRIHRLAAALGWPVLADPRSGCRTTTGTTVGAADAILRHRDTAERLGPEVVLRMGEPPASRVLNTWITDSGATEVLVHEQGAWIDPDRRLDRIVVGQPSEWWDPLIAGVTPAEPSWLDGWQEAEAAAQQAIDDVLAQHAEPTEPGVARTLLAELPDHARLVVASSMPIRDLEWYGAPRAGVWVEANRGANGIDGVLSTALGVALASNAPTVALVGDLAFLHDTSALVGLVRRPADLTVVVVDNDGGGIFSFLPQRAQLPAERFEQILGTPHGVDIGALGEVHGLRVTRPERSADIGPAVRGALGSPGPQLVHVRTDRDANVAVHDELHAAVATALERLP
jgi:2-succinyl-5-enolpyruvyl-6-hydroxy-3-cyclohexene-1-carboxylate synthase